MTVPDTEQEVFSCNGVVVVELRGEIDIATADDAFAEIAREAGDRCAVIDLSGLTFMDASGIGRLIRTLKAFTSAQRHLMLAEAPASLLLLFEALRLEEILDIHPRVEDAVEAHSVSPRPPKALR